MSVVWSEWLIRDCIDSAILPTEITHEICFISWLEGKTLDDVGVKSGLCRGSLSLERVIPQLRLFAGVLQLIHMVSALAEKLFGTLKEVVEDSLQ